MKNRHLLAHLQRRAASKLGRLVVLSGARQTGKTTLARAAFPDRQYLSMEDPALRPGWARLSAAEWIARYPSAIVDEVQKVPSVVETLKAAFDAAPHVRYLLLGSSQILLLNRVKESLAGRAALLELWPLTLPELDTRSWSTPVGTSRLLAWLMAGGGAPEPLLGTPAASRSFARHAQTFSRYLQIGGMPVVHDPELSERDCVDWLDDYRRTYLERDVRDLVALTDLDPFVRAQQVAAARTGCTVNFSDLARSAGVAPQTAKRFLRYLELSYQVILLPPYWRNPEKRLAKMPKLHFVDPGVQRSCLTRRGEPTGREYESAVVAEIHKQLVSARLRAELFHLRTYDGREVDLLIELSEGFVAIEIKQTRHVSPVAARGLRGLQALLDRPLLLSLVLSEDREVRWLTNEVLALPSAWALSAGEG